MKTGIFKGTAVPLYGYMYDANKNRIPDPNTYKTVKLIYKLFIEKNSYYSISKILQKMEILTPFYYNCNKYNYKKRKEIKASIYEWNPETIKRILTNDEYTGNLRRKKTMSRFKSNKITYTSIDEQYLFKNRFEAIIDYDTFEKVSTLINDKSKTQNQY